MTLDRPGGQGSQCGLDMALLPQAACRARLSNVCLITAPCYAPRRKPRINHPHLPRHTGGELRVRGTESLQELGRGSLRPSDEMPDRACLAPVGVARSGRRARCLARLCRTDLRPSDCAKCRRQRQRAIVGGGGRRRRQRPRSSPSTPEGERTESAVRNPAASSVRENAIRSSRMAAAARSIAHAREGRCARRVTASAVSPSCCAAGRASAAREARCAAREMPAARASGPASQAMSAVLPATECTRGGGTCCLLEDICRVGGVAAACCPSGQCVNGVCE